MVVVVVAVVVEVVVVVVIGGISISNSDGQYQTLVAFPS